MKNFKELLKNNIIVIILFSIALAGGVCLYFKTEEKENMQNIFEEVENNVTTNTVENENTEEDENRCKKITSYAANSGAASDNKGNEYYYLRTPSFYEFESEYTVLNDGSILSSSLGNTGIAPALWIKIK